MFSQLRRLPLRRCLHTQAPRSLPRSNSYRLGVTLGASAAVVSYVTWRSTRDQRIALDSATGITPSKSPVLDGPSSETHHTFEAPASSSKTAEVPLADSSKPESESEGESKSANEEGSDGSSQGAYNPVTGEINWDCSCLGGMAYGPCGAEFREAFSCFIYSEEEPKGINCVEKFQAMQTCFRAHPEVYADEIMDDDEEDGQKAAGAAAGVEQTGASSTGAEPTPSPSSATETADPPPPSTST